MRMSASGSIECCLLTYKGKRLTRVKVYAELGRKRPAVSDVPSHRYERIHKLQIGRIKNLPDNMTEKEDGYHDG